MARDIAKMKEDEEQEEGRKEREAEKQTQTPAGKRATPGDTERLDTDTYRHTERH